MAKQEGGGFLFNVFNIGFTVVMFALPSVLLGYWYLYIRDPGGQKTETVVVQQHAPTSTDSAESVPRSARPPIDGIKNNGGIFSENPNGVSPISPSAALQPTKQNRTAPADSQPKKVREAPTRSDYEMRTWADASGKFSIEASFFSATSGKVKLLTSDDRKLDVEIEKLSEDDKQYLRGLYKSKGWKARF